MGGVSSKFFFWIIGIFLTLQSPLLQSIRGSPRRSLEKDVKDWMGKTLSVWRVGRTAEDRLKYGRSVKAATSIHG